MLVFVGLPVVTAEAPLSLLSAAFEATGIAGIPTPLDSTIDTFCPDARDAPGPMGVLGWGTFDLEEEALPLVVTAGLPLGLTEDDGLDPVPEEEGLGAADEEAGFDEAPEEAGLDEAPEEAGFDEAPEEAGLEDAPAEDGLDEAEAEDDGLDAPEEDGFAADPSLV